VSASLDSGIRTAKWVTALVIVLTLLGAEAGVRAVSDRLPPPRTWSLSEAEAKAQQMEARARRGERGAVVFVGTSLMDVAIDPNDLAASPNTPSVSGYNASLLGASMKMVSWWTTEVVVPATRPSTVVIGVSSHELNPNDRTVQANEHEFFRSRAVKEREGTEPLLDTLTRRTEARSALIKYRAALRRPWAALRSRELPDTGGGSIAPIGVTGVNISPGGRLRDLLSLNYRQNAGIDERFRSQRLHDFQVGAEQLRSLRALMSALTANGVKVIVVDMPVTRHYIELHPAGQADIDRYERAIAAAAHSVGVQFVKTPIWSSQNFADPYHLNRKGSKRFTGLIRDVLAADRTPRR
jgi:hypothetical protein